MANLPVNKKPPRGRTLLSQNDVQPCTEAVMILSQEQSILKGQTQFEQIAAFVRQSSREGGPIHEVERGLWERLLNLGLAMLDGYVKGVGTGDLGTMLEYEGRTLRRLEQTHERRD